MVQKDDLIAKYVLFWLSNNRSEKGHHMNEARMLLRLGYVPRPRPEGLAAPLIVGRNEINREEHLRQAAATDQLDTPEALYANTVGLRTPAEKAFPSRNAIGKAEI